VASHSWQRKPTKFCSLACGQRNYKVRQRINKIEGRNAEARAKAYQPDTDNQSVVSSPEQDLIDVKILAFVTSMSERMIFNLIKDPEFPKLKIGKRLRLIRRLL